MMCVHPSESGYWYCASQNEVVHRALHITSGLFSGLRSVTLRRFGAVRELAACGETHWAPATGSSYGR